MSLAGVQPLNRSFQHDPLNSNYHSDPHTVLCIEDIRIQMYSCFTCGVCWLEDHVCLDCAECDGYALQRPCPCCDGRCASIWKRDLTMSHACGKARWSGTCNLQSSESTTTPKSQPKDENTRV